MAEQCVNEKHRLKLSPAEFYTLHEYVSYSSKKLSDVLAEFEEGGVLSQYDKEKPIDFDGFKLFMRTYMETDLPEQLYEDVFLSFIVTPTENVNNDSHNQTTENSTNSNTGDPWVRRSSLTKLGNDSQKKAMIERMLKYGAVMIKDVFCYMSLLEAGTVEEKLEFTFKLYDSDGNGVLDSMEVDAIIIQMMSVARYLGWDVSELEPILQEMMQEIDYDSDGMVTLEEWTRGGLTTVPLLVLLGLDKNVQDDGTHVWRLKHFNKRAYCNLCRNLLVGFGKQGFSCKFCKYTVHERCASRAPACCITTYVKTRKNSQSYEEKAPMLHHWIEGNCTGKCHKCKKNVKSGITGLHCRWCQRVLHNKCVHLVAAECDLGELKEHVLPPTAISPAVLSRQFSRSVASELDRQGRLSRQNSTVSVTGQNSSLQISPPHGIVPLVVFVNPKSGGKQGLRLLRKFSYLLNPRQVFNMLQDGGPSSGLKLFQDVDCRIMVAGGDGTVGWLLEAMDKLNLSKRNPVVVLPLGTGNDLARCLNWGGGYESESLTKIMKRISNGTVVMLDRWQIEFSSTENTEEKGDPVPCNIVNNYFSIGVDASVAHQFHAMREKHPEKFNSRMRNKLWYFEFCTAETFAGSCKNLHENIDVMCDGVSLDLANGPRLEGICLLNIPSVHAGTNLWGDMSQPRKKSRETEYIVNNVVSQDLETTVQDIGDLLIEVIGVENCMHLGTVKTGLRSSGKRLAQCSSVVIRTRKRLPMQIDGEPWMQPPCTISVTHKNQVPMVMGPDTKSRRSCCLFSM